MNKIFTLIFFGLFATAVNATQPEVVELIWPFSTASTNANMARSLVDQANQIQNKYQFVYVNKQGAGGSIGAQYVLTSSKSAVLMASSSFYTRPLMNPDSHNVNNFAMTNFLCTGQPLAMFSKKYSKVADFKTNVVNVGMIFGSVTEMIPKAIERNNQNIKLNEVGYKGTPEIINDMLGGHLDVGIDFYTAATLARLPGNVHVVGITGTRNIDNVQTFKAQGIKGLDDLVTDYFIFVPDSASDTFKKDMYDILYKASVRGTFKNGCEEGHGQMVSPVPYDSLKKLHVNQQESWAKKTGSLK